MNRSFFGLRADAGLYGSRPPLVVLIAYGCISGASESTKRALVKLQNRRGAQVSCPVLGYDVDPAGGRLAVLEETE